MYEQPFSFKKTKETLSDSKNQTEKIMYGSVKIFSNPIGFYRHQYNGLNFNTNIPLADAFVLVLNDTDMFTITHLSWTTSVSISIQFYRFWSHNPSFDYN